MVKIQLISKRNFDSTALLKGYKRQEPALSSSRNNKATRDATTTPATPIVMYVGLKENHKLK